MTTAVSTVIPIANIAPSKYADESVFAEMSAGGGFLPRIMLMNSTSELVKDDKIKQGYYALVKSKHSFDDLTKEFVMLPIAWRPKALEITKEGVISVFDPKSKEFERIAEKSNQPNSQAMFGPEFLCWVPSTNCFASYYMASKTARRASNEVRALLGHAVLMRSALIVGKQNKWWGPVINASSAPMSNLPKTEDVERQMSLFNNPPEKATEVAEESGRPQ